DRLDAQWLQLPPWPGARELLRDLAGLGCRLAVVTNCSVRLGRQAAGLLGVPWDAVVTAEEAGCYKPDPRPYRLALEQLGVQPSQAAFVAGSGYDLFGTSRVGLPTYWHNRVGLRRPEGAPAPAVESPTLDGVLPWLASLPIDAGEAR
ncbi:MAG: HAD family hydrolase, partial [Comamonadaceae bacterium]